jgi:hypothetical protein
MHARHPTAADRARTRKHSTPPTHASSDETLKHHRTQPSSSVNDENINTINTESASSCAMFPSPSSSSSSSDSTAVQWCSCGHCPALSESDSVNTLPCCCWHIEPAACHPVDSPPLCERLDVVTIIRDGVSNSDYAHFSARIKGPGKPASFSACNAVQKRLMLYAALHRILYDSGRGQRDPLPECIKHMVRSKHADVVHP